MLTLENEHLKILVNPRGAELTKVYSRKTNLDYLWNGDPAYWAKHSPVLFPIVGTLKNDTYIYNDKSYKLSRHGFAREMDFELSAQTDDSLTLALKSTPQTLELYPFEFRLEIVFTLDQNKLTVRYDVINTGSHEMYFSIGGHPAFNVPLVAGPQFNDYYIEFEQAETAGRWPISRDGLIEALPIPLLNDTRVLPISHELFSGDALVFKYLQSKSVKLLSHNSPHGVECHFNDFPFLGIWSGKNGNFVCIEPWCGIADSVASHQQLVEKEGINMITPAQTFSREWSVKLF